MHKNENLYRRLISETIDLILCMILAILSYYFSTIKSEILNLNIVHLLSFFYFLYGISLTFLSNGMSIGDKITRIELIRTKTGERSKLIFLFRVIVKAISIYLIADIQYINYITILIILFLFFPIKLKSGKNIYYSNLSLLTKADFRRQNISANRLFG
ncbi:MAG: RDD family protein [Calditrichaceae bacterium]|nr:RDD family protein [Calditrichaceae bacterium]MBN2708949.1 RDD family protein [Calditrichaceae bacterium]